MTSRISVEAREQVLLIGLNRPEKRNAYDLAMHFELASAYGRLDADPELRVGLVFAHGEHFTAGLDLPEWTKEFASGQWPSLAADQRDPFGLIPERRVSKPLVFAMQGICFTVAIELALAGDIRIAASDCRFGQIEVARGIYAVGGATLRMVQEFGWANAQRYLLTGDEFGAPEAYRIGLVQEVLPSAAEAFDRARLIAERISRRAPLGVYASLKSSRLSLMEVERRAVAALLPDLVPVMNSEDVKEGLRSFLERREANFKGH